MVCTADMKYCICLLFLQPIPYWLYKLHGLNITYECEICGGARYRGPKGFKRHYSVSQTFGPKCSCICRLPVTKASSIYRIIARFFMSVSVSFILPKQDTSFSFYMIWTDGMIHLTLYLYMCFLRLCNPFRSFWICVCVYVCVFTVLTT